MFLHLSHKNIMVSLTCKIIFMNLCHREASLRNNCNHWNALIYVIHYYSFCLKSLRCLNVIYYISSRLQRFSPKIKGKIAPSPTTVQACMYKPQDIHVHVIDLDIIFPDVDLHHVQNKSHFISWVFYFMGENFKKTFFHFCLYL